jgi:hypothetical protein
MYVCDSLGYLASLAVVIVRDFAGPELAWSTFYIKICDGLAVTGFVLIDFLWFITFGDIGPGNRRMDSRRRSELNRMNISTDTSTNMGIVNNPLANRRLQISPCELEKEFPGL